VQACDPLLLGLGQTIKELREQRGLSQEGLADEGGAHRTYVGQVERAETNPTVPKVARLAVALEIPLSELLARAEHRAGLRGTRGPKGTSDG
jgi:transcriptional regulator with XRE-family HTH domain